MAKQIVVIGLGRFGISLATTLSRLGHDVLAIDKNREIVQSAAAQVTHAVTAEATHEAALRELGIGNFDIAVVAIGSDVQSSVLVTILLKRLGTPYVIARANNDLHGEILKKIGADKVVFPEAEMGERIGHEAILRNIDDYMPIVPGYGIAKVSVTPDLVGKTLFDLGTGTMGDYGIAVPLIQRGDEVLVTPAPDETIASGDVIIISGGDDKIGEFIAKVSETSK
ncbi:MAG: TrkA family potassium uptake protein [Dehalococcoidia bacterium]|nr:MAG: TrkA family potassium uptake protein [Dehalococcoidia bacterium]